ncbi:hypothetical protein HMPREF1544_07662 [Mucor circinelloides 1006PhL]|uniref:HSF-type DNA-binding domain-containing protein n=1 Tax=Mucor circinelloides f. circinelloides (strain 1006PhL) TaxID=1220926 RepID=S2JSB0_MUCC1|nr:hypothetical protein HMPREF1544_07662 [Mucor circinelloides 1006PhL]
MMNYDGPLQKRPLPTFIKKLWFLLSDSATQDYIFWVDSGQVICIPNAASFSQTILPKFFKHSNWQSFVRQLNLYGFRKVYQLNLAYDESAEKRTVWQFKHASFRKDAPEKLCEITRRTNKSNNQLSPSPPPLPSPPPPLTSSSFSGSSSSPAQNDDLRSQTLNVQESLKAKRLRRSSTSDYHSQIETLNQRIAHLDKKCQDLSNETIQLRTLQISQQHSINSLVQHMQYIVNKDPELAGDGNFQFSFQHLVQSTLQKESDNSNGNRNYTVPILNHTPMSTASSSQTQYPASYLFPHVSFSPPSSSSPCNGNNSNEKSSSNSTSQYYSLPHNNQLQQPQQTQGLPPISSLIGEGSTRTHANLEQP